MPSEKSELPTIDLTPYMLEGMVERKRKLGRYSASEIYKMITPGLPWGLSASKFFEQETITPEAAMRMMSGIITHEQVQRFLDPEKNENKMEVFYKGSGDYFRVFNRKHEEELTGEQENEKVKSRFTLVGRADHLPDEDCVWEIKTSDKPMSKSKPWHNHQVKLYCTMFERSKGYVLQPIMESDRLVLKTVGMVERDDEWFEREMVKLLNYHERLEMLVNEIPEYAVHSI